jgi:hypothetical protein
MNKSAGSKEKPCIQHLIGCIVKWI